MGEVKIVKTPGVCGGRARIDGTRVPVWVIAAARGDGLKPSQILIMYPSATKDGVRAALAYTETNRNEIERDIADQRTDATVGEWMWFDDVDPVTCECGVRARVDVDDGHAYARLVQAAADVEVSR